jgi:hypothetical protein
MMKTANLLNVGFELKIDREHFITKYFHYKVQLVNCVGKVIVCSENHTEPIHALRGQI